MIRRFLVGLVSILLLLTFFTVIIVSIFTFQSYNIYRNSNYDYEGTGFLSQNKEIGYAGAKNGYMRHLALPKFEFFSDDRGGRSEKSGVVAPKTTDILVIGDSFSWGDGVGDQDTYAKIFAKLSGLSVVNGAEPSYATVASLLSIDLFSGMKPKYIVYGFTEGQMLFNYSRCANGGIFVCRPMAYLAADTNRSLSIQPPIDDGSVYVDFIKDMYFPHAFGWRDIYWSIYRDLYLVGMNTRRPKRAAPAWWPPQGDAEEYYRYALDAEWRTQGLKFLMQKMVDRASAMGAKLIFLHIPSDNTFAPVSAEALSAIQTFRDRNDLVFIEASDALQTEAKTKGVDALMSPVNNHPTPEGHRVIAETLRHAIKK